MSLTFILVVFAVLIVHVLLLYLKHKHGGITSSNIYKSLGILGGLILFVLLANIF